MGNAWDAVPNSARNLRFLDFDFIQPGHYHPISGASYLFQCIPDLYIFLFHMYQIPYGMDQFIFTFHLSPTHLTKHLIIIFILYPYPYLHSTIG